ncbi:MAG: hypothetical protein A3H76_01455 [Candidatus Lloydbacteria bacterium RIFCSPLOWO2_02_FULL_54_12]|nr:MAG: hypothetical protein A3H76_01455 [Candidatus Lloydbacteria bacterium RIFCSPLOWO2_02_FULL_54_12]
MRLSRIFLIAVVSVSGFLAPNYAAAYLTWADMHPCGGTPPPASPISVVARTYDYIQLYSEPSNWNAILRDGMDLGYFANDIHEGERAPYTTYTYKLVVKDLNPASPTYGNILSSSNAVSVTTLSANSTPTPTDPEIELPVGAVGKSYTFYTTVYPHPDGQQVKARFDWGDGATSDTECFTPATGGTVVNRSHTWSAVGNYGVKTAEVDSVGRWSSWSQALGYGGTGAISIGRADDVTPPTTPGNFSATAIAVSPTRIDLKWDFSTDNYFVKGYRIYRNGVLLKDLDSSHKYYLSDTAWYYSDYGLPPSTQYTYKVDAIDSSGNISTQSLPAVATTYASADTVAPTVPTGLLRNYGNLLGVSIDWDAASDNISVAGYKIYRNGTPIGQSMSYWSPSTDPRGSSEYKMVTSNPPTTYLDEGPVGGFLAGTTYEYKVAAYDAAGNTSAQSLPVTGLGGTAGGPPPIPSTPTPTSSSGVTGTTYTFSSKLYPDPDGDQVKPIFDWGDGDSDGSLDFITPVSAGTTVSASHIWAASGTYNIKVYAVDTTVSASAWSSPATITITVGVADATAPTAPTSLLATAVSPSQINLSWNASTDAVGVTGYKIYRNGATTPLATVTITSYSDTGLSADTSYSYTVKATDAAGNLSLSSASGSARTSATLIAADTQAPSTPTGLVATKNVYNEVDLSWTASTDSVGVAGYYIFRRLNAMWSKIGQSIGRTYADLTVTPSTTYSFAIKAYDAAGNISGTSTALSLNTPAASIMSTTTNITADTIPNPPSNLRVSGTPTLSMIPLAWSDNSLNEENWVLERRRSGDANPWSLVSSIAAANTTSYTDTSVTSGTSYDYRLAACRFGSGCSVYAYVFKVVTPSDTTKVILATNPSTTTLTTTNTIEEPLTQPFKPYILLSGDAVVHVPYRGTYSEAGAKGYLVLGGAAVTPKRLLGGLDATKPGSYTVTYQLLNFSGSIVASQTRTVVVDPPPVETIATTEQYIAYCDDPRHESECETYANQKIVTTETTVSTSAVTQAEFIGVSVAEVFRDNPLSTPVTDAKQLNTVCSQVEYVDTCTKSLVGQGVLSEKEAESQVKQVLREAEEVTKIFTERVGARAFEDTDQDGVTNYDEVNIYKTDSKKADTNGDGTKDGEQLLRGEDPLAKKDAPPQATSTAPVVTIAAGKVAYEDPRFSGNVKKEIFVAPTIKTEPILPTGGGADNNTGQSEDHTSGPRTSEQFRDNLYFLGADRGHYKDRCRRHVDIHARRGISRRHSRNIQRDH